MSGDARGFNNMETRAVIKEIHAIREETLGEYAPSYATIKNWLASLNVVIFPPVMPLFLDDTKL